MYSASRAPRSATTRARIASSSSPKASSWSGVSVGAEADMVSPVIARGSEVEGDVADRDGYADAHQAVVGRRDLAGQDVAHGAGGLAAASRVADAHAAAEFGREPRVLGLLEQRQPAVGRLPAARGEADDALGGVGVEGDRGRGEGLDGRLGQAVRRPHRAYRIDQRGRPAHERRRAAMGVRDRPQVVAAEASGQRCAGAACESARDTQAGVALRELVELWPVERERGGSRVVEKADVAGRPLVAERAQHRHHRRDPAAAADEQDALGPRFGQDEVAGRARQPDDHPGGRVVAQVARDPALGVRRDRQLELAGRVLRAGGGIGTRVTDAVDVDAEAERLPGLQAAPVVVGPQRERDALRGLVADGGHLGAHLAPDQQRAHELDVAVDAMRIGERLGEVRVQQPPAQVARSDDGVHVRRSQAKSVYMCAQSRVQSEEMATSDRASRHSGPVHERAPSTVTARQEQKLRTRQALLDAALRLLEEQSFSSLSLRQVARAAGVVPTAFYRHFDGMDELGLALIDESFRSLRGMLREARAGRQPTERVIRASVEILVQQVHEHESHFRIIARERFGGVTVLRREIRREIRLFASELAIDLARFPYLDRWPSKDLQILAGLMVHAMVSIAEDILDAPPGDLAAERDVIAGAEAQLRMILLGVPHWRTASPS